MTYAREEYRKKHFLKKIGYNLLLLIIYVRLFSRICPCRRKVLLLQQKEEREGSEDTERETALKGERHDMPDNGQRGRRERERHRHRHRKGNGMICRTMDNGAGENGNGNGTERETGTAPATKGERHNMPDNRQRGRGGRERHRHRKGNGTERETA